MQAATYLDAYDIEHLLRELQSHSNHILSTTVVDMVESIIGSVNDGDAGQIRDQIVQTLKLDLARVIGLYVYVPIVVCSDIPISEFIMTFDGFHDAEQSLAQHVWQRIEQITKNPWQQLKFVFASEKMLYEQKKTDIFVGLRDLPPEKPLSRNEWAKQKLHDKFRNLKSKVIGMMPKNPEETLEKIENSVTSFYRKFTEVR